MIEWWKRPTDLMTFGGVAGCGKTFILAEFRKLLTNISKNFRVAHVCFTGKAASVLRRKLKAKDVLLSHDYCGTIHSAIYRPTVENDEIVGWGLLSKLDFDLIIIDEASMVNKELYDDLSSFGIPILACGDHYQLPPVGESNLNLVANPIIKLEKVHRYAEQNPLTKVSMLARLDGYIPHANYGPRVNKVRKNDPLVTKFINESGDFSNSAIICGFNQTRVDLNKKIRAWKGYTGPYPNVGERIICLKNNKNAKKVPIYNGVQGTVKYIEPFIDFIKLRVDIDGYESDYYLGKASSTSFNNIKPEMDKFIYSEKESDDVDDIMDRFNKNRYNKKPTQRIYLDVFDFGYATTCHKSQGSEWPRVLVCEQTCDYWSGENWNRWLYTSVSRSSDELLIVR